jgi:hypothetical protein
MLIKILRGTSGRLRQAGFANYLVKEGGYDNLAGELKDFDPNKTLNYFEKITKK